MILNREDLKLYLVEDKRVNVKCYGGNRLLKHWIGNTDGYRVYRYLKVLRYYEYWLNTSSQCCNPITKILHAIMTNYYKLKLSRKAGKYNINICRPNSVGYGFRATHINGGVIINCESMENYCVVNSGVVVGVKTGVERAPIIGNHVELATGCKVIGDVVIGDNAIVAPNSVVVKDVEQGTIVSGVPAKFLKTTRKV
ncbi:acetyltransferase [Bacteroides finegoldii]|uniref:Acetyltransferase n=1 Tax=Bacteroides finegoldii TaxID=338188 RepID=A0A174CRA1_9BACE|nr:acetyltransferase [Bacteroides finegoldii]